MAPMSVGRGLAPLHAECLLPAEDAAWRPSGFVSVDSQGPWE